jgi:hypothetical protein
MRGIHLVRTPYSSAAKVPRMDGANNIGNVMKMTIAEDRVLPQIV